MGRRMASSASWRLIREGEHTPFEVRGGAIVGRSRKADLRIDEGYVSRRHARLWVESGVLMVEDLGSANGTFVNGTKVRGPTRLGSGDCVTFDAFEYQVEALAPRPEDDPNLTGFEGAEEDDATPAPAAFFAPSAESAAVSPPALAVSPRRTPGSQSVANASEDRVDDSHPKAFPREPQASGDVADGPAEVMAGEDDITGPDRFERDEADANEPEAGPVRTASAEPALPSVSEPDFDLTQIEEVDEDVSPGAERVSARDVDFDSEQGETRAVPSKSARVAGEPFAASVAMPLEESEEVMPSGLADPAETPAQPSGARDLHAPALLGTVGSLEGHLIQLDSGRVLIGRSPNCDICIDHPAVSRQHAELILSADRCRLRQIEGATGTLLNGNPVGDAELLPGDVLTFGNTEFVYGSVQSLTQNAEGLPPWVWMLVGFAGAGAILAGLFIFVL